MSLLIAGCSATAKVRDIGCPLPGFLRPVAPMELKTGDDLRASLLKRSAELDTANSRIKQARSYIDDNCSKAGQP